MSVIAEEVLLLIKEHPTTFKMVGEIPFQGITNGEITVYHYGNTAILSIIDVDIENHRVELSWIDRYRLEKALKKWFKEVCIKNLIRRDKE